MPVVIWKTFDLTVSKVVGIIDWSLNPLAALRPRAIKVLSPTGTGPLGSVPSLQFQLTGAGEAVVNSRLDELLSTTGVSLATHSEITSGPWPTVVFDGHTMSTIAMVRFTRSM